jgi:A/G-specific adenine glycosylase
MRISVNNSSSNYPFADSGFRIRFQRQLLHWYEQNKRTLPWRQDRDPYRIWLSEIMLQQTRVAAVINYYQRFLEEFPTVAVLASASLDSVLAAWSGLGYYRRARALHEAAKQIVSRHDGQFPETAEGLRSLPGIGRYTAAAIASIAFNEPVAVVDGNVERVVQRVAGQFLQKEQVWSAAACLLSHLQPGDFNQAMMELGATICLPRGPNCLICPLNLLCRTRGELPAREPETRRKQEIHYSLCTRARRVFLVCRPKSESVMPDMWELPARNSPNGHEQAVLTLRHSITVTDYVVRVIRDSVAGQNVSKKQEGRWIHRSELNTLPLTGLTRKILRALEIIQ